VSEYPRTKDAAFFSGIGEPGRPLPLEDEAFGKLVIALGVTVLPAMEQAVRTLIRKKDSMRAMAERRGAMASLRVHCEKPALDGVLRFQIHHTFATMVTAEPVFWMFTIFDDKGLVAADQARMHGLEGTATVASIVDSFVDAFTAEALRERLPEVRREKSVPYLELCGARCLTPST